MFLVVFVKGNTMSKYTLLWQRQNILNKAAPKMLSKILLAKQIVTMKKKFNILRNDGVLKK